MMRNCMGPLRPIGNKNRFVGKGVKGADFVEKSKNRARRKLAKLQSDHGTSPLNIISDPLRASHAAHSANWLVPQMIFNSRAQSASQKNRASPKGSFSTQSAMSRQSPL
jgi:hypothetical protein